MANSDSFCFTIITFEVRSQVILKSSPFNYSSSNLICIFGRLTFTRTFLEMKSIYYLFLRDSISSRYYDSELVARVFLPWSILPFLSILYKKKNCRNLIIFLSFIFRPINHPPVHELLFNLEKSYDFIASISLNDRSCVQSRDTRGMQSRFYFRRFFAIIHDSNVIKDLNYLWIGGNIHRVTYKELLIWRKKILILLFFPLANSFNFCKSDFSS